MVAGAIIQQGRTPGNITRTVALPYPPNGIAVDTRTGLVFVPLLGLNGEGHVAVLDARTGHLHHLLGPFSPNVSLPVDETTQRVFIDGGDGTVTFVDARTGRLLRTTPAGGDRSDIAIDEPQRRVFVTNPNGDSVDVLDARSGRLLHTIYLGLNAEPRGVAIDARTGHVFVANRGTQSVSLLDPAAGTARRVLSAVPDPQVAIDARAGHALVATARGIVVLDAGTGRVLAAVRVPVALGAALAIAVDDRVGRAFVVAGRGVYVLDTHRGRLMRTLNVSSWGMVGVDVGLGRVFIVDGLHGTLDLLDAHTGAIIGTIATGPNPSWPVVDERTGSLYIASEGATDAQGNPLGSGTLRVVDAQHGTLVRTLSAGVDPVGIAVDGRTGQVFIADAGGTVPVPDPWSWIPRWLRHWLPLGPAARSSIHHVPGSISVLDLRSQ